MRGSQGAGGAARLRRGGGAAARRAQRGRTRRQRSAAGRQRRHAAQRRGSRDAHSARRRSAAARGGARRQRCAPTQKVQDRESAPNRHVAASRCARRRTRGAQDLLRCHRGLHRGCCACVVCIQHSAGTHKRPPPFARSAAHAPSMSVRHISGLWRGEAAPAPALADSVPANPILWSLTLLHPAAVSAFGCGYFDDAGDVPGEAILFYMLRGEWAPDTGALSLLKSYTSANLLGVAPHVRYEGRLVRRAHACCARRCEQRAVALRGAACSPAKLTRGTATSFCWAPLRRRGWRTARGASRARGATRRRARTACSPAARRRSSRSRSLLATLPARPPRPRRRPAERAPRLLLRARAEPLAGRALGAQQRRAGAILETYAAAQAHRRPAFLRWPCSAWAASAASCASTRG
jgi:hypothetical protein